MNRAEKHNYLAKKIINSQWIKTKASPIRVRALFMIHMHNKSSKAISKVGGQRNFSGLCRMSKLITIAIKINNNLMRLVNMRAITIMQRVKSMIRKNQFQFNSRRNNKKINNNKYNKRSQTLLKPNKITLSKLPAITTNLNPNQQQTTLNP